MGDVVFGARTMPPSRSGGGDGGYVNQDGGLGLLGTGLGEVEGAGAIGLQERAAMRGFRETCQMIDTLHTLDCPLEARRVGEIAGQALHAQRRSGCVCEVERTRERTQCPCVTNRRVKWPPMKPVAPVTRMLVMASHVSRIAGACPAPNCPARDVASRPCRGELCPWGGSHRSRRCRRARGGATPARLPRAAGSPEANQEGTSGGSSICSRPRLGPCRPALPSRKNLAAPSVQPAAA